MLFFLCSCEVFQSKEARTENQVNEELMTIDWNDVDTYPLFENCNEGVSKNEQRDCFQQTMLNYFTKAFSDAEFQVAEEVEETLYVDFIVDEHGFISLLEIEDNVRVNELMPNFKEEISGRLKELTTVAPAIKRSIPVSMKFRLPLVLNTNN